MFFRVLGFSGCMGFEGLGFRGFRVFEVLGWFWGFGVLEF